MSVLVPVKDNADENYCTEPEKKFPDRFYSRAAGGACRLGRHDSDKYAGERAFIA